MSAVVLVCGNVFDGISDVLNGPAEILVESNRIARIERSVGRRPERLVLGLVVLPTMRNHYDSALSQNR
jgi:hypothetical protein